MEVSTPASGAAAAEDMDAVVERLAAGRAPDIIVRRHRVHANQELCNQELHTAAFITYTPQRLGGLRSAPVSQGTRVVGVLRGGAPRGERLIRRRADVAAQPVTETCSGEDYPGSSFSVAHSGGHLDGH